MVQSPTALVACTLSSTCKCRDVEQRLKPFQVEVPKELQSQLEEGMKAAGIPVPDSEARWQEAFKALKVGV